MTETFSATATLLARAAQGDQRAWNELVDEHSRLLWSVARSFRLDAADANDVVQTTWLRLLEHLDRIEDPSRWSAGWSPPRAGRRCGCCAGPAGSGPSSRTPCSTGPTTGPPVDAALLQDERNRALWEAFARLDEKCRQLLRVAVTHPQAYDEISEALGMPIGSIGPDPAALPHPAARAARGHRGGGGGRPAMSAPWENDEAVLARLGTVLDELDPVPPEVLTEGRALFGLRRLDEELAELVRDSAEDRGGCWRCGARATCG
jgi:DNA-directed RNA polymerase specialized sigma24 family protein